MESWEGRREGKYHFPLSGEENEVSVIPCQLAFDSETRQEYHTNLIAIMKWESGVVLEFRSDTSV